MVEPIKGTEGRSEVNESVKCFFFFGGGGGGRYEYPMLCDMCELVYG